MRFKSGDAEISYTALGEGAPVVLLHSFPSCHELWLPVAGTLSGRYRVILPDLRAHGQSTTGEGPATMAKHAQDVANLCRNEKIERAVFAGISIGGYILFEFWRQFREHVSALILCNTRATPDTEDGRSARMKSLEDIASHGPAHFLDASTEKLVGATTRRNRPDVAAAARRTMRYSTVASLSAAQRGMAERPDSVATLSKIDVPTLIVAGDEDTTTALSEAELMHKKIPRSQLIRIPQAGHYSVLERPDEAGKAIRRFLDPLIL